MIDRGNLKKHVSHGKLCGVLRSPALVSVLVNVWRNLSLHITYKKRRVHVSTQKSAACSASHLTWSVNSRSHRILSSFHLSPHINISPRPHRATLLKAQFPEEHKTLSAHAAAQTAVAGSGGEQQGCGNKAAASCTVPTSCFLADAAALFILHHFWRFLGLQWNSW